jgi:hypothetical protein
MMPPYMSVEALDIRLCASMLIKRLPVVLAWVSAFIAVWSLCCLAFLPCPYETYREARRVTRYSRQWAISQADYSEAMALVQKQMRSHEIIYRIVVASATRVEIKTLEKWQGPMAGCGQGFVLEKPAGSWFIVERGTWMGDNRHRPNDCLQATPGTALPLIVAFGSGVPEAKRYALGFRP